MWCMLPLTNDISQKDQPARNMSSRKIKQYFYWPDSVFTMPAQFVWRLSLSFNVSSNSLLYALVTACFLRIPYVS